MLLGGLWHGAGWQFVVWGGVHGVLLAWLVIWRRLFVFRLPFLLGWLLTFCAVMLAWVPFRSGGLGQTWAIYSGLAHWQWGALADIWHSLQGGVMALRSPGLLMVAATFIALAMPNSMAWATLLNQPKRYFWQGFFVGVIALAVAKAMLDLPSQAFLYFNF